MDKKIFIGIGIFWIAIIFGFVAVKEYTLQTGEEVVLKTRPVDPRDLFRGDYVILDYEISRLDLKSITSDGLPFEKNDAVYVVLDTVESYGVPKGIYKEKPKETATLFIKGKVKRENGESVEIEYGIESYFVPEGEGKDLERAQRGELDVRVAIDKMGNVGIKGLIFKGKEVTFS